MVFIIFAFMILIFWGAKYETQYIENVFSIKNMCAIRGICAVEIVIGHIGTVFGNEILLFPFRKAGVLIVGLFFFLSGYGLLYNLEHKKDYLSGFLKRRFISILLPLLIVSIIAGILYIITTQIYGIELLKTILKTSSWWYVWELLGGYVFFYVFNRLFDIKRALLSMFMVTVISILCFYFSGATNPWYGSTICYPVGMLIKLKEESFISWCKSRRFLKLVGVLGTLFLTLFGFFALPERNFIGIVICRNLAALAFTILVILIMQRVHIGNKISNWLGKISFEIYLIHPILLSVFQSEKINISDPIVCACSVLIASIILGYLVFNIYKIFISAGSTKKKQKNRI